MSAEPGPRTGRGFDPRSALALLFVQLCFGASAVFGKIAMREISPFVLASLRALFGALLLSAAARFLAPGEPPFSRRDRFTLVFLSFFGVVANQLLFINGLSRTTATNAALLGTTIPIFTVLVGTLSGIDRPGLRRALGIPVALAGVLLLLDLGALDLGHRTRAGNAMIVANSLFYSLYLVGARDILKKHSAITVIAAMFRYGALPIILLSIGPLLVFDPSALSRGGILAIGVVVVFGTVVAYALNAWALARTDAATAAVFIYVQPLFAGGLAWVLLGERPGHQTLIAALLIFAGVALTSWPGRRAAVAQSVN